MKVKWIRMTERKRIAYVDGRVLLGDRQIIRQEDGNKGSYTFKDVCGRTLVTVTEYPEWRREWQT